MCLVLGLVAIRGFLPVGIGGVVLVELAGFRKLVALAGNAEQGNGHEQDGE